MENSELLEDKMLVAYFRLLKETGALYQSLLEINPQAPELLIVTELLFGLESLKQNYYTNIENLANEDITL